jgi:hypothetical protein
MRMIALRPLALTLAPAAMLSMLPLAPVGGLLGGLAAGAIINSTRPHYYPPVAEPAPVYAAPPEPVYVPTCHIVRRKVWLDDYAYTFRRERVCE